MTALAARAAPGQQLARFCLLDELGRGAQATVWRAHDERLDREVAIKLLDPSADSLTQDQWLHEARAVSRLAHAHIVPLFEADALDGRPYLVFELVKGPTLAEKLRLHGAMPAREAVAMALPVLDALALAHAQGIVHRDLKPSNILIDEQGRPRVMDFGIAARLLDGNDGRIVGTPGYMSPEAARGQAPAPSMDIFAIGLVLAEMLSGQRLLFERDPMRALQRVLEEDLAMPAKVNVDDPLRNIVQRAIARDLGLRFDSARAMHDALLQWQTQWQSLLQAPGQASPPATQGGGTLDFLLRRMRSKSDFPTLSQSVLRIQRIAASDNEGLNALSTEILKDVALSNKLLRLVNTAHYRGGSGGGGGGGGGGISTVSRAVALVGFAGIRNMALSLMLIEHMKDKDQALRMQQEFLHALTAGQIATAMAVDAREREEAFLGAMLNNLGRLLAEFYLPDEAQAIRDALPTSGPITAQAREALSCRVLGIGYEQLGLGVAQSWGLPDSLQRGMVVGSDAPPARAVFDAAQRLRWLSACANELADAVVSGQALALAASLKLASARFGQALSLSPAQMREAAENARAHMVEMAPVLGLGSVAVAPAAGEPADVPIDIASPGSEFEATVILAAPPGPVHERPSTDRSAAVLAAGIEDISNTLGGDSFNLNNVLRMVLEALLRGLDLQRVVLCLRDAKSGALVGRIGLGDQGERLCRAFSIALRHAPGQVPDLLSAMCARGADVLIADARLDQVAKRLPAWYVNQVNAPTFMLLPMMIKGAPIGLIYGDRAERGGLAPGERELSLMRTLRNQALLAFRHAV